MRRTWTICGISICLALAGTAVRAGGPGYVTGGNCCPAPCVTPAPHVTPVPAAQPAPAPATQPGQAPQQAQQAPATDAFAQAPEAGTEAAASFNPSMIGDLLGYSAERTVFINQGASGSASHGTTTARLPLATRAAFKVADFESPRPMDRVYLTYNYYNNVNHSINPPGVPSFDVHYETLGFEKTMLDGDASIGLRLPYVQLAGSGDIESTDIGDLSIVMKYALVNDPNTGDVLSGGVVLTVPTGPDFALASGSKLSDVIIQPWAGFIYNMEDIYLHGFTSLAVPTDSRDVTILFIDPAVGYWLYRDNSASGLTGIVPTIEAHVDIPLNHRGADHTPIGFSDTVVLTGGVHFIVNNAATLTLGASLPVTGPQPYDIEGFAGFNLRF